MIQRLKDAFDAVVAIVLLVIGWSMIFFGGAVISAIGFTIAAITIIVGSIVGFFFLIFQLLFGKRDD